MWRLVRGTMYKAPGTKHNSTYLRMYIHTYSRIVRTVHVVHTSHILHTVHNAHTVHIVPTIQKYMYVLGPRFHGTPRKGRVPQDGLPQRMGYA